ncbi:c-type cytochrome [Phenylobacterium sp.]|jgi:cytochrome c556|uniref:c-type cytochrome n=1 Tax=Phenylobacterium sp. TaxID=1871053 RepID=UPI0037CA39F8
MAANWKITTAAAVSLAAVSWMGAGLAQAQSALPKNASAATKAAYARHENFEKLGAAFKAVIDETRKDAPNATLVRSNTRTMTQLVTAIPTWFPRGSGVEAWPKSEAKANIWTDAAGFTAAATASRNEVNKLNALAVAGDWAGVRNQIRATGGTCKGCHDTYRLEKKS